ncbi:putative quinol monooxygenase [Ectobacillus antri]|jgi:quinol monooxygenase YgiN|uniref:Quinol monooxygenase n=1 Tax=Ectobacillus antri TaxID=2486280 RepID=A0ABT6H5B1_9BACI|nr:putative quinol monooxygenase [Ectobacillus antri]MDG4657338.1 putative quinol monooxygenase [Ectobacillus antri]MDG5754531.1 putative quinol monooxygenase [Ectobacillus antri]
MTVIINAIIKPKAGKEAELRKELIDVIAPSRAEAGCIQYTLHEATDQSTFVFYEIWQDEEALQSHIETPHYKQYRENVASLVEAREVYKLQKVN